MFGKKKKRPDYEDDEELEEDSEDVEEALENNELPTLQERKPKPSKQLTKEEIGALAEYHQARAMELINIYRRI